MPHLRFAFDRSGRSYDADGRLHVRVSNISKATVNPYRGDEIPGHEALGLDPMRVYYLLRHPDELAAGAVTFNNLPLLSQHVPVTAYGEDSHMPGLVVGSLGTDAEYDHPYLRNSLVVWSGPAIEAIEQREMQELSCAYRYEPDMTRGVYEGLHYDGIMRNIVGNHVALVKNGRAGSDVVVGDSQFEGSPMVLKSRTALMLNGALLAGLTPHLAADAKLDLTAALDGVTAGNLAKKADKLAARVLREVTPKLAADASLDVDDVARLLAAVPKLAADEDEIPDDEPATAEDEDEEDEPETGEDEDEEDGPERRPAMDAAMVRKIAADARNSAIAEMQAIRDAERLVAPLIGEIKSAPSDAASVYRMALDHAGVKHKGVHESALRPMVELVLAQPKGGDAPRKGLAMDAKAVTSFHERFPTASRVKQL